MKERLLIFFQYKTFGLVGSIIILLFIIMQVQAKIEYNVSMDKKIKGATYNEDKMRQMNFYGNSLYQLDQYCKETNRDFIREVTMRAILFDYELKDSKSEIKYPIEDKFVKEIEALPFYDKLYEMYKSVLKDVTYFPVPKDLLGKEYVSFEDSFGDARTYGGDRSHEGTDIIPSIKDRGYFPVLSVSDGVVENIGWLELGGWRVGITSASGGYYYYAHLDSYAPGLKEGDEVRAGQLLGFMGDTGYGKKEGTRGKFIVHLHFGIYVMIDDKQVSVNPYPVLKYLRYKQIGYSF